MKELEEKKRIWKRKSLKKNGRIKQEMKEGKKTQNKRKKKKSKKE